MKSVLAFLALALLGVAVAQQTCLPRVSPVTLNNDSSAYIFDGAEGGEYAMNAIGVYILRGVPQSAPIAIVNTGKEDAISYDGDSDKCFQEDLGNGNLGLFCFGDVFVWVHGDFGVVSYMSTVGSLGGSDNLIFNNTCGTVSVCLTNTDVNVTISTQFPVGEGPKYIFDQSIEYAAYALGEGIYTFMGIPQDEPFALLNVGLENLISYTGDADKSVIDEFGRLHFWVRTL